MDWKTDLLKHLENGFGWQNALVDTALSRQMQTVLAE